MFILAMNVGHWCMTVALARDDVAGFLVAFAALMLAGDLVKLAFLARTGFTVRTVPRGVVYGLTASYAVGYARAHPAGRRDLSAFGPRGERLAPALRERRHRGRARRGRPRRHRPTAGRRRPGCSGRPRPRRSRTIASPAPSSPSSSTRR